MKRVLDLFCGRGGWSKGFASQGIETVGIDIKRCSYPYHLILADMLRQPLRTERLAEYFDAIIGSPPCRDFSRVGYLKRWRDPSNPKRGLKLIKAMLGLVRKAKLPWLMENVSELQKWLFRAKTTTFLRINRMKRSFWGDYPLFLIPQTSRQQLEDIQGKDRSERRAEIPFPVAESAAQSLIALREAEEEAGGKQ